MTIAEGVELQDGFTVSASRCPWLRLNVNARRVAGRWVKLTYSSGLLDPLTRPVLRCFVDGAGHDQIMPGALFGRAIWLGRIPEGATSILISPTNQPGPFAFAIEKLEVVARARLILEVLRRSPSRAWVCLWARSMGMRHLAHLQVKRTLCATPLRDYDSWSRLRTRPFDPGGFDRQPPAVTREPHIRLIITDGVEAGPGVRALLIQLSTQPYPHWSLAVSAAAAHEVELEARFADRVAFGNAGERPDWALDHLADDDLVVEFSPSDLLPDYALAALARIASDHPKAEIFYGDEDLHETSGKRFSPRLRANWSAWLGPRVEGASGPCAIKVGALRRRAAPQAGVHLRRIMRTRLASRRLDTIKPYESIRSPPPCLDATPRASILVATRDRLDLLKRCIESLTSRTLLDGVEVLIIDNGSVQENTKVFLADLARDKRFRVLAMPGRFNFSRLCNQAASKARAPVLVFLNNDTEALQEQWLDELLTWACRPDVGAVGAKLLYRNGRVQHAGIVVGIDGRAGHFERGLGAQDPGYFGRLRTPHEVSAVTAACLAVEARKFFAVGGFDEVNLPVELNDVDLCLRLSERGWKTICASGAHLIHRESASRGASVRPDLHYGDQHEYFRARWFDIIRDDPTFHPALSLDALQASLG